MSASAFVDCTQNFRGSKVYHVEYDDGSDVRIIAITKATHKRHQYYIKRPTAGGREVCPEDAVEGDVVWKSAGGGVADVRLGRLTRPPIALDEGVEMAVSVYPRIPPRGLLDESSSDSD